MSLLEQKKCSGLDINSMGACRLPGCGQVPGDVAHLQSGECPALQPHLVVTFDHMCAMLPPHPILQHHVLTVLHGDRGPVTTFLLDPSTDPAHPAVWKGSCSDPPVPGLCLKTIFFVNCSFLSDNRLKAYFVEFYLDLLINLVRKV